MSTKENLSEFYRRSAFYRYHPGFDIGEREYKIRLANLFSESRETLDTDVTGSVKILQRALESPDNNIITWRLRGRLYNWFEKHPDKAATALHVLWDDNLDLGNRFDAFAQNLREVGLGQAGAQLVIGSTLMMALSPFHYPPIRMEAFKAAMELAGRETLYTLKSAAERYLLGLMFLDSIIEESNQFKIDLRDRLDAQGIIWCIADGWPGAPIPPDWVDDPLKRAMAEELDHALEMTELGNEPGGKELPATEKKALVLARRGQGKFREDVLSFWGNCAVTECRELTLLRASHIKPWKDSTNYERLDHHNGLLLAPNVDAAFDRGLVSFRDDGQIIISTSLRPEDMRALGIRRNSRLRRVRRRHLPYLQYHRTYVFKKKKAV
jgi:hypothetical protein